ncbi:MAG: two-component sensor histidine kinase [Ferruginibacter sp.]|nr:two-component sensor histidine kinase [Ferruginibacter sp.]
MHEHQTEIIIFIVAFFAIFIAFFIGIVLFVKNGRNSKVNFNTEKHTMKEIHAQELLSTQLEMQTQTMQHIGREIHDNVGQKLTLASLYTQQLAYENKAPQITDKIENIGIIINESLAELRQLSKSLTDDRINENNIIVLLKQECDIVNELKKCKVTFNCDVPNIVLHYQTKSILVRIVQEFLQNSLKHAQCKNIIVTLQYITNNIMLFLEDDGKGFDKNSIYKKGIGLNNMKKRAEIIGGIFTMESKIGIGTKVSITISGK